MMRKNHIYVLLLLVPWICYAEKVFSVANDKIYERDLAEQKVHKMMQDFNSRKSSRGCSWYLKEDKSKYIFSRQCINISKNNSYKFLSEVLTIWALKKNQSFEIKKNCSYEINSLTYAYPLTRSAWDHTIHISVKILH